MKLFYLSFADLAAPVGDRWVGGMYIEALDVHAAIDKAVGFEHKLGAPSIEVFGGELPETSEKYAPRNRLLTLDDLKAQAKLAKADGLTDDDAVVDLSGAVV